jgi:NADH-quinone oxidoreductase subunit J
LTLINRTTPLLLHRLTPKHQRPKLLNRKKESEAVTIDAVPFFVLATIAVLAALSMVSSQNAIHAALFLVINFSTIAVFYLALNAPFLAMVQVAVYAGAIMVLFLFVIMLLGAERLGGTSVLEWQRPVAIILAVALLVEGGYLFFERLASQPELTDVVADSSPQAIGTLLFDSYLFPFEITSILLLVAMIGAIVLTLDKERGS